MKRVRALLGKIKRVQPEARFVLSFDGRGISLIDPDGNCFSIPVNDLEAVIIETNDTGPWGMDVWWVLLGPEGKLGVLYPQGATGEAQVLNFLMALPGFNEDLMTKAMGSTTNATFPVWHKPDVGAV